MKRTITLLTIVTLVVPLVFMVFEPENVGAVNPDERKITAEVTEEISLTGPADLLLASSIPGMTGNPGAAASGSANWTVITSNGTGYNLKVKASGETGMFQSNTAYFYAYTPAGAGSADIDWVSPAVGSAEYGFNVFSATAADVDTPFLNNAGATCGNGALSTDLKCWYPLALADLQVIYRTTSTAGIATKMSFKAESNGMFLNEGYYDSYIIVTAANN
ncbi:MAG: hypothetical protein NTW46_02990 [Candidatus Nealsonbacteria bacterium]|nr:hypothetical protein [Candidatus Nealsonbacteria bacterium]